MPTQSKRKIITNRQLNFTLSPVDTHNPKVMPYKLSNYEIDGTWNQHQSIVLDVILDAAIKKYYKKKYKNFPKSWRSKSVIEGNNAHLGEIFLPDTLKFLSKKPLEAFSWRKGIDLAKEVKEHYETDIRFKITTLDFEKYFHEFLATNDNYLSFIENMETNINGFDIDWLFGLKFEDLYKEYSIVQQNKKKFFDYIRKIENTKFKMNYKVKCIVNEPVYNDNEKIIHAGTLLDEYYKMDAFQEIFSSEFKKEGVIINFKSPLGKMILHNTLILDTDWIPEEVFSLQKNAYFLFKRFILNRSASNNPPEKIKLWYEDIKAFLDLNSPNKSDSYKVIDSAFENIKQKSLIKDWNWNNNYTKQRQYVLDFDVHRRPKSKRKK